MSYRFARKEERSKGPWILTGLGLLVVGAGAAWAIYYPREDPQLGVVKELGKQLREAEKLPEDQRRELRDQFRGEMEKLSDEDRANLWRQRREEFEGQMQRRMEEVLSLPPDQQRAVLDRHIDESEKRRKEWESRGGPGGRERGGPGGSGGPRGEGRGGPGAGGPGGDAKQAEQRGSGPRRERTGADSRRNRMLDRTSPERRAQMTEYRRLMNERRKERGLPPMSGRRG